MGDITTAFVNQFRDNVQLLAQQKGSVLRNAVTPKPGVVGEFFFQEQIGATAAVRNTTRHADTPIVNTEFYRRRGTMYDYDWADLIDTQDKLRMLLDPTSDYKENAGYAMGRAIDDEIIDAFSATAYAGKAGGTSVAFGVDMDGSTALTPTLEGQSITNMTIPTTASIGAGNMGIAKLRFAKFTLDFYDVPDDDRHIVLTASQFASLLSTTAITSSDYAAVKALVNGEIKTFMGFEFHRCNRLPITTGTTRACYAWHKSGMVLGVGQEMIADIAPRKDKRNALQVYLTQTLGAVRLEERKVVKILCDESKLADPAT